MSTDNDIEANVAQIKDYVEDLHRFCIRTGAPTDFEDALWTTLSEGLQGHGIGKSELRQLLREQTEAVISRAGVPFVWMFICNLTLLALILWRVW